MSSKLWSVSELADASGFTGQYIRLLLSQRKIKGQKAGNQWVISDDVARAFLSDVVKKRRESE